MMHERWVSVAVLCQLVVGVSVYAPSESHSTCTVLSAGIGGPLSHITPQRSFHQRHNSVLAIRFEGDATTSSWSILGILSPRASSVITLEMILCKYSRHSKGSCTRRALACTRFMLLFLVSYTVVVGSTTVCMRYSCIGGHVRYSMMALVWLVVPASC